LTRETVLSLRVDADPTGLPMALAATHGGLETDTVVDLVLTAARDCDDQRLDDVIAGAGFATVDPPRRTGTDAIVRVRRRLSLPDTVGPNMLVLACGLNPSVHAAEMGVAFGRPGNRFWPAALAAGVVSVDRDPRHALTEHGLGMTDLVKRATPRAAEIESVEYEGGMARLERLVRWLEPAVVCFVGLAGWRAAVERTATAGPQPRLIGGRPAYLMPSTSGLNAHSRLEDLTDHLRAAVAIGQHFGDG
jgi:TDG/mug DNA glycosylase family protein